MHSPERAATGETTADLMIRMLNEARDAPHETAFRPGVFYPDFCAIRGETLRLLQGVDPAFTEEHLIDYARGGSLTEGEPEPIKKGLGQILEWDRVQNAALATERVLPVLNEQRIPKGLYQRPDYLSWGRTDTMLSCFSMVVADVTGQKFEQNDYYLMTNYFSSQYETARVKNTVYHQLFMTSALAERTGCSILSLEVSGVDFAELAALANRLKQANPRTRVYCILNLAAEPGKHTQWQAVVLSHVDEKGVWYHDPSKQSKGAGCRASLEEFAVRWGATSNRGQVVVTRPREA